MICTTRLANPIMHTTTFLVFYGAYTSILIIFKVEKLWVIKSWSCRFPQLCWLLRLDCLSNFEHIVQSISRCVFFMFIIRFAHNCTTLKYKCSFKIKYLIRYIHLRVVWFMCSLILHKDLQLRRANKEFGASLKDFILFCQELNRVPCV